MPPCKKPSRRKAVDKSQKRALGAEGERLAKSLLEKAGFSEIRSLNEVRKNFEFADLFAVKDGVRYAISVKARNRKEWNGGKENSRFKLGKVSPRVDGQPRCRALAAKACARLKAVGAWMIIRYEEKTCDAYFGTLDQIDRERSERGKGPATAVLTGPKHLKGYMRLARNRAHEIDFERIRNFCVGPGEG